MYLGQFAAETMIETLQANTVVLHATHLQLKKKIHSHGNPFFPTPLQPDFNIYVILRSTNIKQDQELALTYLYAY